MAVFWLWSEVYEKVHGIQSRTYSLRSFVQTGQKNRRLDHKERKNNYASYLGTIEIGDAQRAMGMKRFGKLLVPSSHQPLRGTPSSRKKTSGYELGSIFQFRLQDFWWDKANKTSKSPGGEYLVHIIFIALNYYKHAMAKLCVKASPSYTKKVSNWFRSLERIGHW